MSDPRNDSSQASTSLSSRARDALHHRATPYGNYKNYYTFRPASTSTPTSSLEPQGTSTPSTNEPSQPGVDLSDDLDQRLQLLGPDPFRGKRVLDLGTNAGKISIDIRTRFDPASVVGVDIDPILVDDAKRIACESNLGNDDRVSFEVGDFMQPEWFAQLEERSRAHPRFETVLLFSVTKWLHLHHGDAGMIRLFESLYSYLPSGGVCIQEPQERENYGRAVKKNKDLREVYKSIAIWPPFDKEMQDAGFALEKRIERVEGGFSRPLLVWRKS
ncbi:hypothetical protein JCM10212_006143 [Sporobolomyces blumeae]